MLWRRIARSQIGTAGKARASVTRLDPVPSLSCIRAARVALAGPSSIQRALRLVTRRASRQTLVLAV